MSANPVLEAFRQRFVRNPEVNELTPFGFFEAGWRARDTEIMMLREALIDIADSRSARGRAGALIRAIQDTASMALGRTKT